MKKVGIIGCGKIFPRHLEAIGQNSNYELLAVCDTNLNSIRTSKVPSSVKIFRDYKDMIRNKNINFVVVASPNSLHYEQAIYAVQNGCDVLIEKPATLNPRQVEMIIEEALRNSQKAYTVLQVRLNSCVQNLKYLISQNLIGEVRGIGMIQRWQRPEEYFEDWRGDPLVGGGILHECGIHYLDILCYVFGRPEVAAAKKYNTKHKNTDIEDTIYSILDFGTFGGNIEVTISSEPMNIECSLSVMTDKGFIKLGGKAMNIVEEVEFAEKETLKIVKGIMNNSLSVGHPNSYGLYAGSCPNHPELYRNIEKFNLNETIVVLDLIDRIYSKCGVRYYKERK